MATIHPTAIVDPRAQLADSVTVGPGCVLAGPVVIGADSRLISQCYLQGPLTLGARNTVYPFAALGAAPQDLKFNPDHDGAGVVIGDDNIFRESVTIHRATRDQPTRIGSHNYFMACAHVAHDCRIHNHATLVNGALIAGHVEVFDYAILSGNMVAHQFCRIGRYALIAGTRGITKDVPPFCVVYHPRRVSMLNLVGLRRAGFRAHINNLQAAFDIFYKQGLSNTTASERIEKELGADPLCVEFADFIRHTKRGITPYQASSDMELESSD